MSRVTNGAVVELLFTGTLPSGEVFDSTEGGDPITFRIGDGTVLSAFERELVGLAANESKTFRLAPEQTFGPHEERKRSRFLRAEIDPDVQPQLGSIVAVEFADGQKIPGTITAVDEEKLEVDLNHPLAGKELCYEVRVIGVKSPSDSTPVKP